MAVGGRREGEQKERNVLQKQLKEVPARKSVPPLNEIAAVPSGLRSAKTSPQLIVGSNYNFHKMRGEQCSLVPVLGLGSEQILLPPTKARPA
ncbi:hypothetical protein CDAR_485371 [Caerostris darwini]|uniref:Uncharacterized protein n=1 Tax=Caerostris darwini TaxID=1538125 RepID=A0AAV4PDU0_9ARAC|nr:hypothetical protein CDAR_485371 [Caerostris darwini]